MDDLVPVNVPEEYARAWAESAHAARIDRFVMERVGVPSEDSNFHTVHELYPFESIADRARSYISAALDHLLLWADHAAPLKFHPEQRVRIDYRPAFTLARAALEASAQALWMFCTPDPVECVRRHIALVRWDLEELRKSKAGLDEKKRVRDQDAELIARVAPVFSEHEVRPPNGYLAVFEAVCAFHEIKRDIADVERLWRAASGAAHGKYWVGRELQVPMRVATRSGEEREVLVSDPESIIEVLELATYFVSCGVAKFAMWSGFDPIELSKEAMRWLAQEMTFKADADPEMIERLKRTGWPIED